jgi:hypothetical protein
MRNSKGRFAKRKWSVPKALLLAKNRAEVVRKISKTLDAVMK